MNNKILLYLAALAVDLAFVLITVLSLSQVFAL